ncbi:Chaperone protein DnaJ [Lachnellula hyalina]|uniref:Chaperone protein DnaJ n=1 Tax=Lachnellula hyalina TaxID=1316788 RepID=A0A8H8TY85_9HELO|nr:Chaperone protein DnaJ [Lachnellula hyalina]TVY26367.1 Chaperone protein DnaJ [Lachnellula hyalina]
MALNLPEDPYKALGVSKDAQLAEIRSAHRKLVLKCHPDKVQDAALKAIKQDEFQKVQQAYELLSDQTRRDQYDDQLKLFELRKEMGRGNPTPRSNPFEYEVRTAEPRPNAYPRTKPSPQASPKVYSQTPPRSYEDVIYEEPKAVPRKTTSYESSDRKRTSGRDEDRRKHEDEEKSRQKFEKEKEKEKERKHAHSKKEKSRDKEKRRGTEEKHSRQTAYVHEESDEYVPPRTSEKKSSRHRADDDLRQREAERVSIKEAPLAPKWDKHMEYAGQYMQAARRKVAPAEEDFVHPGLRRAETYAAPSYNVRHVAPQFSDDDTPRRSSARKESKRASEAPTPRTRDKSSKGSSRRSPATSPKDAYIVEPPSPPPVTRKPTLQTRSSAPPDPAPFSSSQRERDRPHRSKTQDYPRNDAVPPLPRAQTFASGDRKVEPSRDRGGSRLKKTVDYSSAESDSDSPSPQPQRRSHSPPPRRAAPPPEPIRYIIDNGRSVPISTRHRSDLRDLNEDHYQQRDRSESPHGRRSRERSAGTRNASSRQVPIRSQSQNYYPPDAPEPVIHTVRPKMAPREATHQSSRGGSGGATGYFNDVKYAPAYKPENHIASGYLSEE